MMMITMLICGAAIMQPAANYYSSVSPETAAEIITECKAGNYHSFLDYNGDGELTIADAVCVSRKYEANCRDGNVYHLGSAEINEIIAENYTEAPIEYEITSINDNICCLYAADFTEISRLTLLMEFEDAAETLEIQVNPFTESLDFVRKK